MRTHKPDVVPAQTVQCPSPQQEVGDGETKGPVHPQPPPPVSPPGCAPARAGSGARVVGEQMPPGASPRYLIEAGWGTPAPAEKTGSASSGAGPSPFPTQGRGSACGRVTGSGRCPHSGPDRAAPGAQLAFPRVHNGFSSSWGSGEQPGIMQSNVPPGMKNQAWELPPAHGLWVETP